ncbi:MAG: glycine betaine ABC transporter substrate-binding protein, partial [bacterium]
MRTMVRHSESLWHEKSLNTVKDRLLRCRVCLAVCIIGFVVALVALPAFAQEALNFASKRFTESYILGGIVTQTAQSADETPVFYKPGLGNTAILFAALQTGSVAAYPEYTGTIARELLK